MAVTALMLANTNAADLEAEALRNKEIITNYVNFENIDINDMIPYYNGLYFTFIPRASNQSDFLVRTYSAVTLPSESYSSIYSLPVLSNSTRVLTSPSFEVSFSTWTDMRAQYLMDTRNLSESEAYGIASNEEWDCFFGAECTGTVLGQSSTTTSSTSTNSNSDSVTTVTSSTSQNGATTTRTTVTRTENTQTTGKTTETKTTTTTQLSQNHNFSGSEGEQPGLPPEFGPSSEGPFNDECDGPCEGEGGIDGYLVDEEVVTETTVEGEVTEETDAETTVETTTETFVEAEKEWEFSFAPIIMFDFLKVNKVIATSTGTNAKKKTVVKKDNTSFKAPRIESSKSNDTFYMKKMRTTTGALGVAMSAQYVNNGSLSNLTPVIGIAPIVGRTITYEGFLDNKKQAISYSGKKPLASSKEVLNWNVGEKVRYDVSGGVLTLAGLGYAGLHMGVAHVAQGVWAQTVEKLSSNIVKVSLENTKLRTISKSTGYSIVSIGLSDMKVNTTSSTYLFDIKDEEALDAMNSFIAGDFTTAEKLAEEDITKVLKAETNKTFINSRMKSFTAGIPFINFSKGKGEIFTKSTTDFLVDGTKSDLTTSMYIKNKGTRVFNKLSNTAVAFTAVDIENSKDGKELDSATVGMFSFIYSKTNGKVRHLRKKITSLVKMTGLTNELKVNLPSSDEKGYVEVMFNLKFDKTATNILMNKFAYERHALQVLSAKFIDAYFEKGDSEGFCNAHQGSYSSCKSSLKSRTKKSISKLVTALGKMKYCSRSNNRKCMTKNYADFGKHLSKNQFTFQTIFNLLKGRGISGNYSVTGQQVRRYELALDWKPFVETK